jgi:hypothetical protein
MSLRHALLCSLALIGTAHAETPPESITLNYTPPKVGKTWTSHKHETSDLVVTADGKKVPVSMERTTTKKIEVLEVTKDVTTKAKFTYTTDSDKRKSGDKTKGGTTAISGKTYIVTAGSPTVVATAKGPAPDDEAKIVRDRAKRFGKPERMPNLLAKKKFTKNTITTLPADEVADVLDDPTLKVKSLTLIYRGMKGSNAMFDIVFKAEGDKNGSHLVLDMKGKFLVDPKTGDEVESELGGTLKATGKEAVEGTMKMTSRHTP